jgi:hypothetical protein
MAVINSWWRVIEATFRSPKGKKYEKAIPDPPARHAVPAPHAVAGSKAPIVSRRFQSASIRTVSD